MLPLAYSAISIEQRYSRDEDLVDAVVSTFLFTQMGNKEIKDELGRKKMVGAYGYVRSLIHLAQNERSHEERMHALRTFPTPYLNFPYGKLLLGVAVIIQVALAVGFTAYPLP